MKTWWMKLMVATAALLVLTLIGCNKSPVDSLSSTGDSPLGSTFAAAPPDGPAVVKARVEMVIQDQLRLILKGCPDTVVASQNCQVTRWRNGGDAPISFDSIMPGDSAEVHQDRNQNGLMYTSRIRICSESGFYDLAFRDTILTIDYTLGQFTVKGRTETILVDSLTVIWGVTPRHYGQPEKEQGPNVASGGNPGGHGGVVDHFDAYLFTDLAEGDVVEVRAKIIDEVTLRAVSIKIANCEPKMVCDQFESTVATIDYTARLVTFADQPWTGWVCPGAKLLDVDGNPIALEDFLVGDAVAVKAQPGETDGDNWRVCQMQKL